MLVLCLLMGRAGCGKTTEIYRRMAESGALRGQLLLVPEQSSHEAERMLCERNGNAAQRTASVSSFTRLETRVLGQIGGLAETVLDAGGRMLVMYSALKAVSSKLSVYAMPSRKPEFLKRLLTTVDELKSYCVTAEELGEAAEEAEGLAGQKLRDLALILGAYEAMTGRGHLDPRDRLTRLAQLLRSHRLFADTDLYIDGFTDFTPQERLVILELLRQANSVTVALTCDGLTEGEGEGGVFSAARQTATRLTALAQKCFQTVQVFLLPPQVGHRAAALEYLETNLFADDPKPFPGDAKGVVEIFSARSRRDEVEWTARKILGLVREGGLRYRDITVTARTLEPYHELIDSLFSEYQIPVFQSAMTDILQKPIFTLITAALDAVTGRYSYDDMFRYLKTGLTDLPQDECDLLENYAIAWNIRGSQWTSKEPWNMHPRGYHQTMEPQDQALLNRLEQIRCKVISPLEAFRKKSSDINENKALLLYSFLEKTGVPTRLQERAEQLLAYGEPELAQEYGQLWDIFSHALEQYVELLGDLPIELGEFSRLLRLLLSEYTVGSIPASLDRVTTGDAPRLENRAVKALFLLGGDDGSIPQVAPSAGLLTDRDRDLLTDCGLELAPRVESKMDREMTIVYAASAQPSERFLLTWPTRSEGGGEKRPSFFLERVLALFPNASSCDTSGLLPAPRELLRLAWQEGALDEDAVDLDAAFLAKLWQTKHWQRGRLSAALVGKLYSARVSMSASRMDQYKSCHFAYYMRYGLKAKPRKKAGIHAPEYGTFVHAVLEYVLRAVRDKGGIRSIQSCEVKTLVDQAVAQYVANELQNLEHQSPRFRYLFRRLQRSVLLVVENVMEELRASEFQPIAFELGFGAGAELPPVELTVDGITLGISGFVDRVDGWVKDGRLYLRVVDYKTGRKSFDFTDIWNGLGLQMLLYLFTLEDCGTEFFGQPITPAGVLYLPAREAVVAGSRGMPEEARAHLVDRELVRKGLLLDDPAVLEAMETTDTDAPRFLPIRVSAKTGKITGDALVSAEKLGRLKRHIQSILTDIGAELASGVIAADPFWRSATNNACLYCDFAPACQFEDGLGGDHRRWIPTVKNSEFWDTLTHAEGEGSNGDETNH